MSDITNLKDVQKMKGNSPDPYTVETPDGSKPLVDGVLREKMRPGTSFDLAWPSPQTREYMGVPNALTTEEVKGEIAAAMDEHGNFKRAMDFTGCEYVIASVRDFQNPLVKGRVQDRLIELQLGNYPRASYIKKADGELAGWGGDSLYVKIPLEDFLEVQSRERDSSKAFYTNLRAGRVSGSGADFSVLDERDPDALERKKEEAHIAFRSLGGGTRYPSDMTLQEVEARLGSEIVGKVDGRDVSRLQEDGRNAARGWSRSDSEAEQKQYYDFMKKRGEEHAKEQRSKGSKNRTYSFAGSPTR